MTPSTCNARIPLTLVLLLCPALGVNPADDRPEWQLAPRLVRGQEYVYRGTLREQSEGRGVQFYKTWKLEVRALVLESKPSGACDVAFLTRLSPQQTTRGKSEESEAAFVRLDLAEVDPQGRLTAPANVSSSIPLEGLATWEHGFVVEFPRAPLMLNQDWLIAEKDRPGRKYRIVGTENLAQASVVKVIGEQATAEWNQPRADTGAWRRVDTLYVAPKLGLAQRVVRELERREPAHKESTYRLTADYELDSSWKFDGNLLEDRKKEIAQWRGFQEALDALLPPNRPQGKEAYQALLARVDYHVEKHPATPYREALNRLRTRIAELAQNPNLAQPAVTAAKDRLTIGKPAPEFVVDDLKTRKSISLRNWHGKTMVMVFYQPNSDTSSVVLRQMQRLADQHNDAELAVVGFSMSDDLAAIKRVESMLSLTIPALAGSSLRQSYEVDATPRVVILDRESVVRGAFTGWGPEVLPAIEQAVRKCVAKPGDEPKPEK